MQNIPDIEAVTRDRGTAVLTDGSLAPITNWIDQDGDDCEPADAVVGVAGPTIYGWFTFMFCDVEVTLQ